MTFLDWAKPETMVALRSIYDGCATRQHRDNVYCPHCTIFIIDTKNNKLIILSIGRRLTHHE